MNRKERRLIICAVFELRYVQAIKDETAEIPNTAFKFVSSDIGIVVEVN